MFQPIAEAMLADDYGGAISGESVDHPGNGHFEAGFHDCIDTFLRMCGDATTGGSEQAMSNAF